MPKKSNWYETNEESIGQIYTPPATATWCPVAHDYILSRVEESIYAAGFQIESKRFFLENQSQRFFATLKVVMNEKPMVVGLLNSHDKTMAATILAGEAVRSSIYRVSFFHEVRIARKHTKFIERDFPGKVAQATTMVLKKLDEIGMRQKAYEEHELAVYDSSDAEANVHPHLFTNDALVQMMQAGAFAPSALPKAIEAINWRKYPNALDVFEDIVDYINGNGSNPFTLSERTQAVYGVLDHVTGFGIKQAERALEVMAL